MSDERIREQADERFAQVLKETGARDPREFYRNRLRELRDRDDHAFRKALHYYETRLLPAVAAADSEPLGEWLDYGRFLSNLIQPGETVEIDPSGRSRPYRRPVSEDHMVLHLPTSTRHPALAVGLPAQLSPAQRATYRLLVEGSGDGS